MTTGAQTPEQQGNESGTIPRYMLDFVRDNEQQHAQLRVELIERTVRVEQRESESRIIRWTVGTTVGMSTLWGGILLAFINTIAD